MSTTRSSVLFSVGFALALSASAWGARGADMQVSALDCGSFDAAIAVYQNQLQGPNVRVECPFPMRSALFQPWQVTQLTVNVHDLGAPQYDDIFAWACVHDWASTSFVCGTGASSAGLPGGVGWAWLAPPRSEWTVARQNWFAYVEVYITHGSVQGWYATN